MTLALVERSIQFRKVGRVVGSSNFAQPAFSLSFGDPVGQDVADLDGSVSWEQLGLEERASDANVLVDARGPERPAQVQVREALEPWLVGRNFLSCDRERDLEMARDMQECLPPEHLC
ncbi:hypothetical protein [Streptomyces sp. bgisy031]|uniref:hypothetical protein n=1 Tax=Streptomyces sp. bgisy031 TaxID=3413772 RepID=UPI003D71D3B3